MTAGTAHDQVIARFVAQHADDAAFLWSVRDGRLRAPHVALSDLRRHDERIEAHLDGLRIAGDAGWAVCREALAEQEPGEVFAAAVLAFESARVDRIRDALTEARAGPPLARAAVSALGWLPTRPACGLAERLTTAADPVLQRIGLAALAVHRVDPGVALGRALTADDPALLARALRAAGELGRADTLPLVRAHCVAENPAVRVEAAWSAALLARDPAAVALLLRVVEVPAPSNGANRDVRRRDRMLHLAVRRLDPAPALHWVQHLAAHVDLQRDAIAAAGALGDPALVPWLLDLMRAAPLARVAGAAFTDITGADIGREQLRGSPPPDFHAGPTEDPDDENVTLDPDEHLPWPNPAAVEHWWTHHRASLPAGTRHLLGRPITDDWLAHVLRHAHQPQRAATALELALRHPGTPLFEVRAPGSRQQRALGA
ncbi:hypothetical protein tb265_17730 [Gemmatimonadetes bacterium T265]|nr:hypothetical protein tb265_17730 [Gemmatimonadetes bacterium T265]